MFNAVLKKIGMRKRGRVVDCTGLENRQRETVREFESHRFRQYVNKFNNLFYYYYY